MMQEKIVRRIEEGEQPVISHIEFGAGMALVKSDALPSAYADLERSDGEYVAVGLIMVTKDGDVETIELDQRIPMGELLEGQLFDLRSFWIGHENLYNLYENALDALLNQQGTLRFYKELGILRVGFSFGSRYCIGTLTQPQAMKCLSGAYAAGS